MFPEFSKVKLDNIDEWHDFVINFVKSGVMSDSMWEPTVFIYSEHKGEIRHIIFPVGYFFEAGRKDHLSGMLKHLCTDLKPGGIIFSSEAWVKKEKMREGETREQVYKRAPASISDDPDREEVLLINYERPNKAVTHIWIMHRDSKEKVINLELMPDAHQMMGRFTHLLYKEPDLSDN